MRPTKKDLVNTIESLTLINQTLEAQVRDLIRYFKPCENRITNLERVIRGGEFEKEGLIFRITFLESLIQPSTHIKPVSKKVMSEIKNFLKEREESK